MFGKLFGIGMTGKLEGLIERSQKDGYSCGNQIHCGFRWDVFLPVDTKLKAIEQHQSAPFITSS